MGPNIGPKNGVASALRSDPYLQCWALIWIYNVGIRIITSTKVNQQSLNNNKVCNLQ